MEVSLKNELNYLRNVTAGRGSYRQWIYQTCTEFGFCKGHAPIYTHELRQIQLF